MTKVLKRFLWILPLALFLAGCSQTTTIYDLVFGEETVIKDGEKVKDDVDPFGNKGLYTDPELKLDGVRDEAYDYPTGSGRHLVYASETETTYVSIHKGEKAIYFLFECEDDSLSTLNVEDINLVTAQSDSVELYVDAYGTGGQKRGSNQYEFRVTASGRIYSYLTGFVANVFTYGTVNDHTDVDQGFNVEGYISYAVLGEDVNKNTPTSFAFARVTKTGNRGYKWNGEIDPQIPDNYLVLHKDNKFYKLNDCPLTGAIRGNLVDLAGNPVAGAKVSAKGIKTTYTNSKGEYALEFENASDDFEIEYSKSNYLTYSKRVSKADIRLALNNEFDLGNTIFLSLSEASYQTTISGKVTERDGKTPIANALVELNHATTKTDSNGNYTLFSDCNGYSNVISYSEAQHLTYQANLGIATVNVGGTTELSSVQLDEGFGDVIGFGNSIVGFATARVVRGEDAFKVVLKTEANMESSEAAASYFELFIDTKESNGMDMRNATDYLFCLGYREKGVVNITNYGGKSTNESGIKTTYGRINDLYYVEADIPYNKIGITKEEIFGLYFGIKNNYNWAGMYDQKGAYIQAEATINYVRLDKASKFFKGSCNTLPFEELNYTDLGIIGNLAASFETVGYTVSYAKAQDYVMLKLELLDNGVGMLDQGHSLNIYLDMNCSASKSNRDQNCYHISLYPGKPVSYYNGFDVKTNKESTTKKYELNAVETWTYLYDNTIYIKISNSIFTGEQGNIGFAVGLYHDTLNKNSFLTVNNKPVDFNRPSTYFIVDDNK